MTHDQLFCHKEVVTCAMETGGSIQMEVGAMKRMLALCTVDPTKGRPFITLNHSTLTDRMNAQTYLKTPLNRSVKSTIK